MFKFVLNFESSTRNISIFIKPKPQKKCKIFKVYPLKNYCKTLKIVQNVYRTQVYNLNSNSISVSFAVVLNFRLVFFSRNFLNFEHFTLRHLKILHKQQPETGHECWNWSIIGKDSFGKEKTHLVKMHSSPNSESKIRKIASNTEYFILSNISVHLTCLWRNNFVSRPVQVYYPEKNHLC